MTRRRPDPPLVDVGEAEARRIAELYAPIWGVPVHVVTITHHKIGRRSWFSTSLPPDRCARNGWTVEATITPPPARSAS
jgi:hypothetical protein